jgi:hypothetical protein
MADHVHDCTGPDMRCHCGFVFTVPRYSMSLEVFDGQKVLANHGFSTDGIRLVIATLREEANRLEAIHHG